MFSLLVVLLSLALCADDAAAQRRARRSGGRRRAKPTAKRTTKRTAKRTTRAAAPRPVRPPAPSLPAVNPFVEIQRESDAGNIFDLPFTSTSALDKRVRATAQVSLRNRTLLVRVQAKDMPVPAHLQAKQYTLWAIIPNYGCRLYLGDLPILYDASGRRKRADLRNVRGKTDTAYHYSALPAGAAFGGLVLTTERPQYTLIANEPLQPLLLAYVPETAKQKLTTAAGARAPTGLAVRTQLSRPPFPVAQRPLRRPRGARRTSRRA